MKENRGSCARVALDIQTYYAGMNQLTHPNVIAFDEPWHGYQYYMAYTAYPYANGAEENPCLAASNDLINWVKPEGLINPIACCEETACDELKDTHLLYRKDTDELEIWYLGRLNSSIKEKGPLYCFRKVSKDGIRWSEYEIMYQFSDISLASQSVIFEDGCYHFWGIWNNGKTAGLYYMVSDDGKSWSRLKRCSVDQDSDTDMWHGAITHYEGKYHFVWMGRSGGHKNKIYYATSDDGQKYDHTKIILENNVGWSGLYRPALLMCSQGAYLYYGVIRCDGKWLVALSHGPNVMQLSGTSEAEVPMDLDRVAATKKMQIKQYLKSIKGLMIPRLFALIPVFFVLCFFIESMWLKWTIACCISMIVYYLKFYKEVCIYGGFVVGTVCMAAASFVYELFREILRYI